MPSERPSNSGCTWIVGRALRLRLELDGRSLGIVHSLIFIDNFIGLSGF